MAPIPPSIADWLRAHDLEAYVPLFLENEVDFGTLQILSDADLKELGLPFGPRKRVLGALAEERRRGSGALPLEARDPEGDPRAGEGLERRQLTALFSDMVGFTDLAGRVDAETLEDVIRSYEHDCAACIERFGGHILHCLGDGIVALFGFPVAHEDDAERAIRAGLEIVKTMERIEVPEVGRLRVRVGIANGVVVVSTHENRAIGETLNVAARLQGIAEPDTIVVTDRVRRLAGGVFHYTDEGEKTLKGVARPVRVFRIEGPRDVASRFEANAGEELGPLVGRERETAHLLERWAQARTGRGQIVFVSGEPGIGKSRTIRALGERLASNGARCLSLQCSSHQVDSAFHPFLDGLDRLLDWRHERVPEHRLDQLETLLVRRLGGTIEDVRCLGTLLSLPCEERYGPLAITPQRRREATIRAWINFLASLARTQPSLIFLEDLHWADPATLEVLDLLAEQIRRVPLLLVLTARPEFPCRWAGPEHVSSLTLARLTREETSALVARLADGRTLGPTLVQKIVERTDGVPLFVEELTRSLLESTEGPGDDGPSGRGSDTHIISIPATLRDLLMARLDRVAEVKEVAQIGAVIGREFQHELLAAVAPMTGPALQGALRRLVGSGLAFRQGEGPDTTYTFKHALVQDAAYDSLVKARRKELHGLIAKTLEARFPETRHQKPELLAWHYTRAGLKDVAVPFWHRAGALAMQRFVHAEASAHLRKGLSLIGSLPPSPQRDLQELELRTLLGPAVVARHGWTAAEIGGLLEPALALARSLGHGQSYLPVLHLLWVNALTGGRLGRSREWADEMLATAAATGDSQLEICGHRAAMTSCFWLGDLVEARRHGDIVRALYDPVRHAHIAKLTNSDPLTGDGIYRAQYLWMLGLPDQAAAVCRENQDHARRLSHPFDLAFALTLGSQVYEFRGEPARLLELAAEGERVGREHGVPVMSEVLAEISKGIAWLRADQVGESVAQLREALGRLVHTGQKIWAPYIRALLAEALARDGDPAQGLELLDESLAQIESQNERSHYAEVLRIKGELLDRQHRDRDAETCFRDAIAFARQQQAKSWELRATLSLARLLARRGENGTAADLLTPVYREFTEGLQTRDLREARALLAACTTGANAA